jgi:hypothetical protein
MTAKEFLRNKKNEIGLRSQSSPLGSEGNEIETMIEFAKYHVEQALKTAFDNSEMRVSENDTNEVPSFTDNYDDGYVTITVSKNSIINAYPLNLIK